MRAGLLALVGLALGMGCDNESTVEVRSSCLYACSGSLSDAEIQAQVDIWTEVQASLSDTATAGGWFTAAAPSLGSLIESILRGQVGAPAHFTHQGSGVYAASPSPRVRAELRYHLAAETSFAKAGDAISFDVFDPGNYFSDLSVKGKVGVDLSGVSAEVQLTFSKAGPGAELLGLGPSPQSPVKLDLPGFQAALSSLQASLSLSATPGSGPAAVSYTSRTKPLSFGALSGKIALPIENFSGGRTDLAQSLALTRADLALSGSALDGSLSLLSSSSKFSFLMRLDFPTSALADVTFGCTATSSP